MHSDTDLLGGYEAIGAFLGLTAQQVKFRARKKLIPIFYQGRTPCATKSGLRAYLARQMAQAETPIRKAS